MNVNCDSVSPAAKIDVSRPPRLLDRFRRWLAERQFAGAQIEEAALWVEAFIRYFGLRHPRELRAEHVAAFVTQARREHELTPAQEAAVRFALRVLYEDFLPAEQGPDVKSANPTPGAVVGQTPEPSFPKWRIWCLEPFLRSGYRSRSRFSLADPISIHSDPLRQQRFALDPFLAKTPQQLDLVRLITASEKHQELRRAQLDFLGLAKRCVRRQAASSSASTVGVRCPPFESVPACLQLTRLLPSFRVSIDELAFPLKTSQTPGDR